MFLIVYFILVFFKQQYLTNKLCTSSMDGLTRLSKLGKKPLFKIPLSKKSSKNTGQSKLPASKNTGQGKLPASKNTGRSKNTSKCDCGGDEVIEKDDGGCVCSTCGIVLDRQEIVNSVQFTEGEDGCARMNGRIVGDEGLLF